MALTYREQLQHPNWQRRRLEILSLHGFMCQRCYAVDLQLHVHHRHYERGRMLWEYADHELRTLCVECHSIEHAMKDTIDTVAECLGLKNVFDLMAMLLRGQREAAIAQVQHIIAENPRGREG